jgi:Nucleotidyl transferase AbiEii toxin, Type IV TA system
VDVIDNRAKAVACYDPGYTLVEKLQTISTKFRKQQETSELPSDFMRHYYDVYSLLGRPEIQAFIGTKEYTGHKRNHFPEADNQNIAENEAFRLSDPKTRAAYAKAYAVGSALYYNGQPTFEQILKRIEDWACQLYLFSNFRRGPSHVRFTYLSSPLSHRAQRRIRRKLRNGFGKIFVERIAALLLNLARGGFLSR